MPARTHTKTHTKQQIGMGGGMKVGINVWRALNTNHSVHPAWISLSANPLTEEDLPRSIEPTDGAAAATGAAPVMMMAGAAVGADGVKKGGDGGGGVARKPTVEVQCDVGSTIIPEETDDDELAERGH